METSFKQYIRCQVACSNNRGKRRDAELHTVHVALHVDTSFSIGRAITHMSINAQTTLIVGFLASANHCACIEAFLPHVDPHNKQ